MGKFSSTQQPPISGDIAEARALMPVPLDMLTATANATTQFLDGYFFYAKSANPVANLACCVTTAAGATPTISRLAAYLANPVNGGLVSLAAATADDSTLFTSTGMRRKAPSSGAQVAGGIWTPTLGQYYFLGGLCITAASVPTFACPGSLASTALFDIGAAAKTIRVGRFTAAADLPVAPIAINTTLPRGIFVMGEY